MTINNNYFEDVKSIKRRQKVKRKSNLDREGERGGAGGGGGLASSAASRNTCKILNVNFANILGVVTPTNRNYKFYKYFRCRNTCKSKGMHFANIVWQERRSTSSVSKLETRALVSTQHSAPIWVETATACSRVTKDWPVRESLAAVSGSDLNMILIILWARF